MSASKLRNLHSVAIRLWPRTPLSAQEGRSGRPVDTDFLPHILELTISPPNGGRRLVLRTIVALCACAFALSFFAYIDVVSTAPGRILPVGKIQLIQSVDSGNIKKLYVREGNKVIAGQPLVEIDAELNKSDATGLLRRMNTLLAQKERIKAELANAAPHYDSSVIPPDLIAIQEGLRLTQNASFESKLNEAKNSKKSRELNVLIVNDGLTKSVASLALAREKESRMRAYVGSVIPSLDYMKIKDDVAQLESTVASQRSALKVAEEEAKGSAHQVEQIIAERRLSLVAEQAECESNLSATKSELDKADSLKSRKILYAPVSGTVQTLSVNSRGEAIMPGQTVASIVPEGTPTTVEAYLSNEDVGFVKIGQMADIKVDAFPFQHYGTLTGIVTDVSADSESLKSGPSSAALEGKDPAGSTMSGLVYKLSVRITGKQKGALADILKYRSGMSVQVDVRTDRQRIIDFLLDPISGRLRPISMSE